MALSWGVKDKCILQVFTGSVAVYRAIDVARQLRRLGARVIPAATKSALKLVSRELLEWATGERLYTLWDSSLYDHTRLAELCDVLLIDPATLDALERIATLHADNEVSLLARMFLGADKPVLVVPAMHEQLWREASHVLEELLDRGVFILEPVLEEGKAKHPDIDEVVYWIDTVVARGNDYSGYRLLVTAGPTREYIDDLRFISNPSSGLMGVMLASEAVDRGARVVLVHGPIQVRPPRRAKCIEVQTTEEMAEAAAREARMLMPHMVFHVAAPLDFKPAERIKGKLRVQGEYLLRLVETPKVSRVLREAAPSAIHVGFTAAPTESIEGLIQEARNKLEKHGFDIVVANSMYTAFSTPDNEVVIVAKDGPTIYVPRTHKRLVARRILDYALAYARRKLRRG